MNGLLYTGFERYAASNDLILLMPQVEHNMIRNTFSCWDIGMYFGAPSGDLYDTKESVQPKAIMAMIERLTSPRDDRDYTNKNILKRPLAGFFTNFN